MEKHMNILKLSNEVIKAHDSVRNAVKVWLLKWSDATNADINDHRYQVVKLFETKMPTPMTYFLLRHSEIVKVIDSDHFSYDFCDYGKDVNIDEIDFGIVSGIAKSLKKVLDDYAIDLRDEVKICKELLEPFTE